MATDALGHVATFLARRFGKKAHRCIRVVRKMLEKSVRDVSEEMGVLNDQGAYMYGRWYGVKQEERERPRTSQQRNQEFKLALAQKHQPRVALPIQKRVDPHRRRIAFACEQGR